MNKRNNTIVVGIDDSDGARIALRWAIEQAAATSSSVTVIHGYEPSVAWIDVGTKEQPKIVEAARKQALQVAERVTDDVCGSTETAVPLAVLAIEGDAAEVLLEAAQQANLLVVGSRGRGSFKAALLGSVSHRVAQHAPCPVVIIPA